VAKAVLRDEPLKDLVQEETVARIGGTSTQDLANIAWSFAFLTQPVEPMFQAMCREIVSGAIVVNSQDLSNIVWACEVLNFRDE